MALLVKGELLAQEQVFCCEGWAGAQTEEQKAPCITHKCGEETRKRQEATEPLGTAGHRQGIPQEAEG